MSNGNKNIIFVEANVINISEKFQLHPPYGFRKVDFRIFFRKFSLSADMATNQKSSGLDKIHMFGRGLLKKHICKTFVTISAVR